MFTKQIIAVLLCLPLIACVAEAGTIMHHEGANDPETEGWSQKANWTNLATGPIYDDQGLGVDAWMIQDNTGVGEYTEHTAWTPEVEAKAWENGWTARWELRVAATPDSIDDWTPMIGIGFDHEVYDARFVMTLGTDSQGENTLVKLGDGAADGGYLAPITIAGVGYHHYEYVFDPSNKTVDCFVDGTVIASDIEAKTHFAAPNEYVGVIFGSRHTAATSTIHYSLVELDVVDLQVDLPGDANGDGKVNDAYATLLSTNWQIQGTATWAMGDFNGDGNVDDSDATLLATNWQAGVSAAAAVPEPGISVLLIGVLAMLGIFHRR